MLTKQLKTGISVVAAAAVMAFVPGVSAQSMTDIVNTGDGTSVDSSTSSSTDINVSSSNTSNIVQDINAHMNTGNNTSDGNISSGGGGSAIRTGAAGLTVGLEVEGNHNATGISGFGSQSGSNMTDIVNTGDHADIDSSSNQNLDMNVSNSNSAWVSQMFDGRFNTGGNTMDGNIGSGGEIITGNAAANVGLGVDVNHNDTAIGGNGTSGGSSMMGNEGFITNTGDGLDFDISDNSDASVSVSSTNYMSSMQSLYSHFNSGKNMTDGNIGGSGMATGAAGVATGASISGNHNATLMGGLWGLLMSMMS